MGLLFILFIFELCMSTQEGITHSKQPCHIPVETGTIVLCIPVLGIACESTQVQ